LRREEEVNKAEIDAAALDVYRNCKELNEDLRSDVIVWIMENGKRYPPGTGFVTLVREAKLSIADRISGSQDAVDVSIRKESRGVDGYYDHAYTEEEDDEH
jgi:hypothetical protein